MTTRHIVVWQTCSVILDGGRLSFGVMIRVSRCFIKSYMDWSLYQFLHILNVLWYNMPSSSCLQTDPYFCQLLLLFILPNDGYSLEQADQLISSLIQILTLSNQEYTPSGIYCFYLAFKLFFLTLTLSSMLSIILHFLCCTISLLLLTHHAQHIQIILVRGFWIMRR